MGADAACGWRKGIESRRCSLAGYRRRIHWKRYGTPYRMFRFGAEVCHPIHHQGRDDRRAIVRMLPVYTINDIARRHGHYPDLLPGQHNHVNFDIKELHAFAEDLLTAAAAPENLHPASPPLPQQGGEQISDADICQVYTSATGQSVREQDNR